jgi:hypothetical protein
VIRSRCARRHLQACSDARRPGFASMSTSTRLVFVHACKMGLEGIVSKRKDSPYRSGRSAALDQEQEPHRASGEMGSRGRLGSVTVDAGVCEPKGAHQLR